MSARNDEDRMGTADHLPRDGASVNSRRHRMRCDDVRPLCIQCGRGDCSECVVGQPQERSTVQILEDIISRSEAQIQGLQDLVVAQDSQLAPPQPLPNTLDQFDDHHTECALSSADQSIAQPFANRSSVEESELNIASDSQGVGNRIPSIHDLAEPSKEKAVPQDKAEGSDGTSTSTQQSIEELLAMVLLSRAQELRKNNTQPDSHSDSHSSPQSGQYFAQPYSNPILTVDAAHSTLMPEYRMPWPFATMVHHHHHHHYYNVSNVSPPPIINKNIVRINNKNTSDGSDNSDSGDDGGEH